MLFNILWPLWVAAFFVIEGVAMYRDAKSTTDGFTLSEHIRRWFRVNTHEGRTAWLGISAIFLVWFIPHIAYHWNFGL